MANIFLAIFQVGENKLLTAKKTRFNPYQKAFEQCRICKQKVHQVGSHYCQPCAYSKGKKFSLRIL